MLGSLVQVGGKEEEEHSRVNVVCLRDSVTWLACKTVLMKR